MLGTETGIQAPDMYRVTMPYEHITKRSSINAGWLTKDSILSMLAVEDQRVLAQNLLDVYAYDIIVLRRFITMDGPEAGEETAKACRTISKDLNGKQAILVYEADDDYSGRYRPADVTLSTWKPYITQVDAVIGSVKPLAKLMEDESGLSKSYVAPNYINYDFFTTQSYRAERERDDKITVMLAGTATHDEDWKVVADVMPGILADYPNVSFLVAGNVPDYLYGKCEFVPPVHYSQYPVVLRQADILCCSLDPNDTFNESKSYIKAIEGWCAKRQLSKTQVGGCAVIASKATAYKGVVTNRHNGLMVEHTLDGWDSAIRLLIEDHHLRQKIQVNGLKAGKGYDITVGWRKWYEIFEKILADGPGGRRT